ncbi:MAG: hypothetical protein ABH846_04975 [Patescibacteria group bacterium]
MPEKTNHTDPALMTEEERKFRDAQYLQEVFASGDQDEIAEIQAFYQLNNEQVALFQHNAQLRERLHKDLAQDLARRKEENLAPTEEELKMGTFIEGLEPQVRDAVIKLRAKGYSTWESGFMGFEGIQRISFNEPRLADYQPPKDLVDNLSEMGIELIVEPNVVAFKCSRQLRAEDLKSAWDLIAAAMPTFDDPTKPSKVRAAEDFRT